MSGLECLTLGRGITSCDSWWYLITALLLEICKARLAVATVTGTLFRAAARRINLRGNWYGRM